MSDGLKYTLIGIAALVGFIILIIILSFGFKLFELPWRNLQREATQHSFEYSESTISNLNDMVRDWEDYQDDLKEADTSKLKEHYQTMIEDTEEQMREHALRIVFSEIPEKVKTILDLDQEAYDKQRE